VRSCAPRRQKDASTARNTSQRDRFIARL
jgi:hypothetical protein